MIDRLQSERFSGFADIYDIYRPSTPIEQLRSILEIYGPVDDITIADIGCGTGLSTIPWAKYAKRVFGIEPNPEMIQIAKNKLVEGPATNVTFLEGESTQIPIADKEIDLITCSQSFHWMETTRSLEEFHRILRQNGLLAIYDYDWPISIGESLEMKFGVVIRTAVDVLQGNRAEARKWPKNLHLRNIIESNLFRFVKEICFEATMKLDAERYIGMIESQGAVQQVLKLKSERFINILAETKKDIFKEMENQSKMAVMTYRLRLAIK